jgi:hypothetical protein
VDCAVPASAFDADVLRRHCRAELRDAVGALRRALAAPALGRTDAWAEQVQVAALDLSGDLRLHVEITEGPDGLHAAVLASTPRLANAVRRLGHDHVLLANRVDQLLACVTGPGGGENVEAAREHGIALLDQLLRHRRRGADLVFEAYQADLGGEA